MLTTREAFKVGFLTKCAELGLSQDQTNELIRHSADFVKEADMLSALRSLMGWGTTAAIGAPIALGLGGGAIAAGLSKSDLEKEDLNKQEVINELRRLAKQTKLRQQRIAMR